MNHSGLFRIGEVSKLFHVSISILRHYDKIGLLKPEYTDPDTITLICNPPRRLTSIRRELSPSNYLDLEYSIRELEQSEENSVTFLGKVGLGISAKNLIHHRYRPYDIVFIFLDEEDQFKGKTVFLPEETCLSIRFQGGHERAPEYYEKLMSYIEKNNYPITGFSKEITMIDYGLTDDVTRFVTEIQIPKTNRFILFLHKVKQFIICHFILRLIFI